mmetsp:Transcript_14976/g.32534  ORF Transcript_14976/g.32534 Transcript_14976/m.32534 type:complete len:137 (+) Transcript_14976:59-469(+)
MGPFHQWLAQILPSQPCSCVLVPSAVGKVCRHELILCCDCSISSAPDEDFTHICESPLGRMHEACEPTMIAKVRVCVPTKKDSGNLAVVACRRPKKTRLPILFGSSATGAVAPYQWRWGRRSTLTRPYKRQEHPLL